MASISRAALFGKLDELAYRSMESATVFCRIRGHGIVDLVHWIHQILQNADSDLHRIVRHYELDMGRLSKDLLETLDRLPKAAGGIRDLSGVLEEAVEKGWLYGSLKYGDSQVRVGHVMVALATTPSLRSAWWGISKEFTKIKADDLAEHLRARTAGSPEEKMVGHLRGSAPEGSSEEGPAPALMGRQEALAKFAVDLTERARRGDIEPIVGRDEEIRQIIHVLMRRRQNNPILTGEAGVGKTAVVEGFALRVARGQVPPALKELSVWALDVGLLQAGASAKGEFEQRLRQVIEEVQASPKPIVLFIDEAHTLVGAGGPAGTGDAANLLKPALARGMLRTIAATTWAEYKKHIEKDPALTRRFQVIVVEEPSADKALGMMRGMVATLEKHHAVELLDEAVRAAVHLSRKYIPDRQLPDKAVSLLDTACARVAISRHGVPPEIEDIRHQLQFLETEGAILERERAQGVEAEPRKTQVQQALAEGRQRLAALEERWTQERTLVDAILERRRNLRQGPGAEGEGDSNEGGLGALQEMEQNLRALQGEAPLVLSRVDEQAVAAVVSDWTGIPVGRMVRDEVEVVLSLGEHLERRVKGQSHALDILAKRIQTARAGLENPEKPTGVFLLVGPSGVGKTETALALGEVLYGGEENVITINMSEFQEAHTVSTLKGAPPGYVGYGEGGVLTEAVRRRPYSVVLLDEVEKAHPDVHELFFQVFDKGWMEDGQGTRVDFRNTIFLLTSNAGSDTIMEACAHGRVRPSEEELQKRLRGPLLQVFPPALLGRMVTVPYYPLGDELLGQIVELQLSRIQKRVHGHYGIPLTYDGEVVALVRSRCTEVESGGRMIDAVLTHGLLPPLSRELLLRKLDEKLPASVAVTVKNGDFAFSFEEKAT